MILKHFETVFYLCKCFVRKKEGGSSDAHRIYRIIIFSFLKAKFAFILTFANMSFGFFKRIQKERSLPMAEKRALKKCSSSFCGFNAFECKENRCQLEVFQHTVKPSLRRTTEFLVVKQKVIFKVLLIKTKRETNSLIIFAPQITFA